MAFRLLAALHDLFERDARGRVLVDIPPEHIDGGPPQGPALRGNDGYFRIWVSRMFLAQDREWFSSRYPSVHVFTTFDFGGRPSPLEIAAVAGPGHLKDVDKEHLDRVISVNQIVSPLAPFRGGSVELEAGLLSMQAKDDMRRFLNAMGTVASLVAVPQLSAALTIADKVATGAKELADAEGNQMVLGYQNTFVGEDDKPGDPARNELRDRWIAVINAPADDQRYRPERLWLNAGEVKIGDSSGNTEPLTKVDWMALRVETLPSRDDTESLDSITGPLRDAIKALGGDNAKADTLARQAILAAFTSDDLIDADRKKVAARVKQLYLDAKQSQGDIDLDALPTIAPEPTDLPETDDIGTLLDI